MMTINQYDDGQSYTEDEYAGWLVEAGFEGFERVSLSGGFDLITARRPETRHWWNPRRFFEGL